MSTRRIDRIWLFGGLTLIAILVAAGWFFLISPQYADESKAQDETGETAAQLSRARSSFSALQAETKKLGQYEAELARYQAALPVIDRTKGIPDFLRELQSIGIELDVEVSAYSASQEIASEVVPSAKSLPIVLDVKGEVEKISRFLEQLQDVQPRAVLISTATVTTTDDGKTTLSLTLDAFVTSTVTEKAD